MTDQTNSSEQRKAAEYAYSVSAFDYVRNPIGSRDWMIYYDGYKAALLSAPAQVAVEPMKPLSKAERIAELRAEIAAHLAEDDTPQPAPAADATEPFFAACRKCGSAEMVGAGTKRCPGCGAYYAEPAQIKCRYCGNTSAISCTEVGCHYLESGADEPQPEQGIAQPVAEVDEGELFEAYWSKVLAEHPEWHQCPSMKASHWQGFKARAALAQSPARQEPAGFQAEASNGSGWFRIPHDVADWYSKNGYQVRNTYAAPVPQHDADPNAPWLTLAHTICADAGIPPGHITDRLNQLRERIGTVGQEPVFWMDANNFAEALKQQTGSFLRYVTKTPRDSDIALYAAPVPAIPPATSEAERYRQGMANWKATAEAKDASVVQLISALKRIAAYPQTRADELSVEGMRQLARDALAAPQSTVPQDVKDTELCRELLMAVARKFPGESRHETALRYIRKCEEQPVDAAIAAQSNAGKGET